VKTEHEAVPEGFGDKSKPYPQNGVFDQYRICMRLSTEESDEVGIPLLSVGTDPGEWNRLELPR
jgi:hypothetical protein